MGFTELADRVWLAAPRSGAANITVVAGSAGVLLVDAPAEVGAAGVTGTAGAAGALLDDVRRLGAGPVTTIVLTHAHVGHAGGAAAVRAACADPPVVVAHETAAEALAAAAGSGAGAGAASTVTADRTFSSALVLDLGDRAVELVHPGRAHTAGDLLVRVPDADVLVAGDLVSAAAAPAAYGPDCWPLEWPVALDVVLQLLTRASVVVPGHGGPVDRDAVEEHRALVGIVAEMVRDAAGRGTPLPEALAGTEWPWPRDAVEPAVRRGLEQLPRSRRRLPLL